MFKYNFDENANDAMNTAFAEARDLGHRFIGTEHLLLGIATLDKTQIAETFAYYKISTQEIREEIIKLFGRGDRFTKIEDYTPRAKACFERSHEFAIRMDSQEIMLEHLFMSIMGDKDSNGYQILSKLSLDLTKFSFSYLDKMEKPSIIKQGSVSPFEIKALEFDEDYEAKEKAPILEQIGENLTEKVMDDSQFNILGRDSEINRLIQVLSRKTKNNPCLVGDAGIGKTAIVYGLAKRIAEGNVPDHLKDKEVILIHTPMLVTGTMYRGQFEERMQLLIEALKKQNDTIAFFDEIHTLAGMGATGEKSLDAFAMLKPYLNSGEIQIIGTTTYEDYEKFVSKDNAIMRRLIKIDVEEPDLQTTIEIVKHIKEYYEEHHKVIITDDAISAAVRLTTRYIETRKQPDKSIDIIDEACSRKRLHALKTSQIVDELKYRLDKMQGKKEQAILAMDFESASQLQHDEKRIIDTIEKNVEAKQIFLSKRLVITTEDIEDVISEWVKIPVHKLSTHEKDRLIHIDSLLSKRIIGQSGAVDTVSRALRRSRLGIKDPGKPIGVFLFVGPTGVGKTELSKAIADIFYGDEKALVRIDMSEFMEKHSVSKLIGSPPGYEGHQEGGLLTNAIMRQAYSVVIFDEIEKAHPEVTNILLQIMDEGHVKDGRGQTIDFKNTLIVMTSNLGAHELKSKAMGFGERSDNSGHNDQLIKAAKDYFKAEFINRIDEIVLFNALGQDELIQISRLLMENVTSQLLDQQINIVYDEAVLENIARFGADQAYGARPLKRYIDRMIKDQLAISILSDENMTKNYRFYIEDDTIQLERIEEWQK